MSPLRTTPTVAQPLSEGDVLRAAADLLEKPGAWTQGALYRDSRGFGGIGKPVCWCVIGATMHVDPRGLAGNADRSLAYFLGVHSVAKWNDAPERTQAEVVSALRAAAESAAS